MKNAINQLLIQYDIVLFSRGLDYILFIVYRLLKKPSRENLVSYNIPYKI